MRRRLRHRRDQRGAAIVEFALVFPLVMMLVFGIIQYGYHYWSLSTAAATAREAARQLVVGTDPVCTRAEAVDKLSFPHVGDAPPTVEIAYGTPPDPTRDPERGDLVTVTVRMTTLDLSFLPLPGADGEIVEVASNRVENVPIDPLPCD